MEPGHGADGDMRGVVGVFGWDDALAQAGGGEVFHLTGHLQQGFGAEGSRQKDRARSRGRPRFPGW